MTPLGASVVPEAAPSGLLAARRWSTVTLQSVSPPGHVRGAIMAVRMWTLAEDADAPIAKKRCNGRKYSMVKGVKSGPASTSISCILMPRSGVQKAACSDVFRGDPHHL